jgi:hypothetical protein
MKTTNIKYIAYALSALMLMQSCIVYNKTPVSVDEAVATNNKVKVYSIENKKHIFNKLVKEEDKIYGISSLKGLNKSLFAQYVKEIDQKKELVKILLPFEIKEIYTFNKKRSTILTLVAIFGPPLLIAGAIGIAFATIN